MLTRALPCGLIFLRKSLIEIKATSSWDRSAMNNLGSSMTCNRNILVVGNHHAVLKHLLEVAKGYI
jgi:hypothetical protein